MVGILFFICFIVEIMRKVNVFSKRNNGSKMGNKGPGFRKVLAETQCQNNVSYLMSDQLAHVDFCGSKFQAVIYWCFLLQMARKLITYFKCFYTKKKLMKCWHLPWHSLAVSSELSLQSSSPSHTHAWGIHLPLLHRNSVFLHSPVNKHGTVH